MAVCGQNITTGDNNTCLGYNTAEDLTTGDNNVYLGSNVSLSSSNVNREYVIGYNVTGKGGQTFFGGTLGAFTTEQTQFLDTTSDRRIKKNIVDNNEGLSV